MKAFRISFVMTGLLFFLAFSGGFLRSSKAAVPWASLPLVTVTLSNVPIGLAAKTISEQVGYRIDLQEIDPEVPVSGIFADEGIGPVFNSLLKDFNVAVVVDDSNRKVLVQSLGRKSKSKGIDNTTRDLSLVESGDVSPSSKKEGAGPQQGNDLADNHSDPFSGENQDEIATLHATQSRAFEQELTSPDTIDPLTGMTNAQIRELHSRQSKELELKRLQKDK